MLFTLLHNASVNQDISNFHQSDKTDKLLSIKSRQPQKLTNTGCPVKLFRLCFCHFLGFWSTYRGFSDLYSTALEICYKIGTRILKIDLEIAEIIEVKVATFNIEIIFLPLCNSKMSISK